MERKVKSKSNLNMQNFNARVTLVLIIFFMHYACVLLFVFILFNSLLSFA